MHHSSDTISQIAGALARAQAELENPGKALTATIVSPFPREEPRTFRYASLASGLEIIRKCLTKHEIATVQATSMQAESGLIKLTTTLVHSSGEWIASDWPVCSIAETVAPHRMGAALTYARRYALFTLVGIAGEDDLDAPDLAASGPVSQPLKSPPRDSSPPLSSGAPSPPPAGRPSARSAATRFGNAQAGPPRLGPEASRRLRDQLTLELTQFFPDAASLTGWALRALPLKNQLASDDAQALEAAFEAKLRQLEEKHCEETGETTPPTAESEPIRATSASDTVVVRKKPIRERDRHHLKFVATQACLICGRTPSDAHHVKFAEQSAMGRKVSDRFTVPLCRLHHRELHRRGNERSWWQRFGIAPLDVAAKLWDAAHSAEPAPTSANELASGLNGTLHRLAGKRSDKNDETNPKV